MSLKIQQVYLVKVKTIGVKLQLNCLKLALKLAEMPKYSKF